MVFHYSMMFEVAVNFVLILQLFTHSIFTLVLRAFCCEIQGAIVKFSTYSSFVIYYRRDGVINEYEEILNGQGISFPNASWLRVGSTVCLTFNAMFMSFIIHYCEAKTGAVLLSRPWLLWIGFLVFRILCCLFCCGMGIILVPRLCRLWSLFVRMWC